MSCPGFEGAVSVLEDTGIWDVVSLVETQVTFLGSQGRGVLRGVGGRRVWRVSWKLSPCVSEPTASGQPCRESDGSSGLLTAVLRPRGASFSPSVQ